MIKIIGIYARVSTEDQAKHGYSIDNQITECKAQAYKDYPNTEIKFNLYVDDGISGEILERPGLTKMREDIKSGILNHVYCYDPDRLARKLMHQLIIDEEISKYIDISFVNGEYNKTPEGVLFFQLRGAIAQFEKAKINERMSSGRKAKAKKGKVVKDYHTYGYNYDRETGRLVVNEAEAIIVRFIFDAFIGKAKTNDGKNFQGINGIANYLTKNEVPTKKGAGKWHRQVVRQILMNTTYIGKFYQNRWNTEGIMYNKFKTNPEDKIKAKERPKDEWIIVSTPAIVEESVFKRAQELLQVSRQRWSGKSKHQYLLSGLLRCAKCGNTMTGRRAKNWGKYVFEYTDFKNTAGAKNKGCGNKIKCDILDNYVWEKVFAWLKKPKSDLIEDKNEDDTLISFNLKEKERLEKLINEKEESRKKFISLMLSGKILGLTENEINEALLNSQNEIENLKTQLLEIEEKIRATEYEKNKINILRESLEYYLHKNPEELTFEDKREFIRTIVREIRVGDIIEIYLF